MALMCDAQCNAATHNPVRPTARSIDEIVMDQCVVNGSATGLRKFEDEFHAISLVVR
jgi:hypothetical protein